MERLKMARDENGDFMHPVLAEDHPLAPHVLYRLKAQEFDRKKNAF